MGLEFIKNSDHFVVCVYDLVQAQQAINAIVELRADIANNLVHREGRGWASSQCESCARTSLFAEEKIGETHDCLYCGAYVDVSGFLRLDLDADWETVSFEEETDSLVNDQLRNRVMQPGHDVSTAKQMFNDLLYETDTEESEAIIFWKVLKQFSEAEFSCVDEQAQFNWYASKSLDLFVHTLTVTIFWWTRDEHENFSVDELNVGLHFLPTDTVGTTLEFDGNFQSEHSVNSSDFSNMIEFFDAIENLPNFRRVLSLPSHSCSVQQSTKPRDG